MFRDRFPPLLKEGERAEPLAPGYYAIVNSAHTFNTDTILLASFSLPRPGEICADFGSGCGVIPLLWCLRSSPALVYAVELQQNACSMAERSVQLNGMGDKIRVVQENIRNLKISGSLEPNLHRIVCNPPYKPCGTGVKSRESSHRIARHEVACSFSEIAETAAAFLRWGGFFDLCMRPERLCGVITELSSCGLEPKRLRFVQQRESKAPFLFLLEAKRGGKPGLRVEPALFIEAPGGNWSEEMLRIYGDYKENQKCPEN